MKKCPRCGHELKNNENFCSHCGLDLRRQYRHHQSNNNKAMTYLLYVIVFFSFITIPLLYSRVLGEMAGTHDTIQQNEQVSLPEINGEATGIIASYDTLADFQNQFSNVDGIVTNIKNFEDSLAEKKQGTWSKAYQIQIADNYNIYYELTYQLEMPDHTIIKIHRSFDRAHSYNDEKIMFVKNDITTFNDLFLTEDQENLLLTFTGKQETTSRLMNNFKKRQDEFEKKKETIGHYGLGNYDGQSSFVVYRKDKTYSSQLTYVHTPESYIY